jgi:Transposase DDE domain
LLFEIDVMPTPFSPISVFNFSLTKRRNNRKRSMFNNLKLERTYTDLCFQINKHQSIITHQISNDRDQMLRFYAFWGNERVKVREMIQHNCSFKNVPLAGRHVLVIGDSTSLSMKKHKNRIKDPEKFGVLEDNKSLGFFAHPSIVVDAQSNHVLGLSDLIIWTREKALAENKQEDDKAKSQFKPEALESHKWVLGAQNSYKVLEEAAQMTFIFDRDADDFKIYDAISELPKADCIIRLRHDRKTIEGDEFKKISACLEKSQVLGTYEIDLPALDHYSPTHGKRITRPKRTALIEYRACPIGIVEPKTKLTDDCKPIEMWAVHAKEITPNLPKDVEVLDWKLITTHPTQTPEQAKQIIEYYKQRWVVEQLNRTVKTECFDIEGTELETFDAIMKQTAMAFHFATKVLQIVYARTDEVSQPITEVFDEEEIAIMKKVNAKMEGKTEVQKNPFDETKTSWAYWVLGRLGGWKGYASQNPAGPTTIMRGLMKFHETVWTLSNIKDG